MELVHNFQGIVALLVMFTVLVVAHEWGHFIVARMFKIPVEDFSIGFGKRLFRIGKLGDTEYNVRMLPLGGFVKIYGMEADEEPINIAKEKLKGKAADPDAGMLPLVAENQDGGASANSDPLGFNARPLYQRALVIFAGPLMSFLLGYMILCCMGFTTGMKISDQPINRVLSVLPHGEGQRIGLRAGDWITAIDGKPVKNGSELVYTIHHSLDRQLILTVRRDDQLRTFDAKPRQHKDDSGKISGAITVVQPGALAAIGVRQGDDLIGIDDTPFYTQADAYKALNAAALKNHELAVSRPDSQITISQKIPANPTQGLVVRPFEAGYLDFEPDVKIEHLGFARSFEVGTRMIGMIFSALGDIVKQHKLGQSVGGVVMIAVATENNARVGPIDLISEAAQISISLAVLNLLPIPILDGGHLLAFLIEFMRGGRKMTERQQQAFLLTGLTIIGLLVILVNGHNIIDLIHHNLPQ